MHVRLLSASASPRNNLLTTCLLRIGIRATLRVADEILVHSRERLTERLPMLDFALVALRRALGLPRGVAFGLFALGRTVGWIAHALEQRERPAERDPSARRLRRASAHLRLRSSPPIAGALENARSGRIVHLQESTRERPKSPPERPFHHERTTLAGPELKNLPGRRSANEA